MVGAAVAVLALGAVGLLVGVRGQSGTGAGGVTQRGSGKLAPAIDLPRLNGDGNVSLASFRGRPVVVNFFASWCVPCRTEMPAFQAVSTQLKDRVAFMGVNHNDDRAGGLQLLADTGVRYPTGYDPNGRVAAAYGLFGMPSTLFIGADGRLLETHTGQITREQLEQTISRLFGV
jgi:cytochrome c biogenesis protein CcmG/thiol:disulfide interchange protein DsbE